MKRKPLARTLSLRPVVFAKEHDKNLAELLIEADKTCVSVGDRIRHDEIIGDQGPEVIQSYFYNNFTTYENGAVYFELWSYVPGKMPAGFTPNLTAANAEYDIAQVLDQNGNPREIINISHVLVYKNCSIVEATKGTGGTHLIEKYVNKLLRARCAKRPPHVAFNTAISNDLFKEIEQGGGAVSISLGISAAQDQSENRIAGLLSGAHTVFSKTSMVALSWTARSHETLDTEEVVTEARVAKQDDFDKIFIKLKRGSIKGLSKYKITEPIEVRDVGGKNPDHVEIRDSMADYFGRLITPNANGYRTLDEEGNLVT